MFFKVRKNLKFILKVQFDDEENALIDKISPILNQLGMDETNLLDDFVYTFFSLRFQPEFDEDITFSASFKYLIWRKRSLYHHLMVKPLIFYEFCYKYQKNLLNFLDSYRDSTPSEWRKKLFSSFSLFFFFLEGTTWNPDTGFFFSFPKFKNSFSSYFGIGRSYSRREEMLGRKINFRRKIRKKRFEDY